MSTHRSSWPSRTSAHHPASWSLDSSSVLAPCWGSRSPQVESTRTASWFQARPSSSTYQTWRPGLESYGKYPVSSKAPILQHGHLYPSSSWSCCNEYMDHYFGKELGRHEAQRIYPLQKALATQWLHLVWIIRWRRKSLGVLLDVYPCIATRPL